MRDRRLSWGVRARRLLLAAALFGVLAPCGAAPAQDVVARLAQGDTASAIAALEARVRAEPTDAESHYQLGRLRALRASHRATEFEDRRAAEHHLSRAIELDASDPRFFAALAVVRLKQGVRLEAARLVSLALERAEQRRVQGDALSRRDLAWVYYLRGFTLERRLEDGRNLVHVPGLPVSPPDCGGVLFCENFSRPESFNARLYEAKDLSELVAPVRAQVLESYRAALAFDPGYLPAARGLLALLYDDGRWEDYLRIARGTVDAAPDSAWAHLLLAAGLWRAGRHEAADSAFARGLARLPHDERRTLEDPGRLLRPGDEERVRGFSEEQWRAFRDIYWTKTDPLHLTPLNERRLEHLTRMVFADLRFAAPEAGLRGWDTERGDLYVRFGPPRRIFQVRRESDKEASLFQIEDALSVMGGGPGTLGQGGSRAFTGGRWIFWNYQPSLPSFIFERALGSRIARHKLETPSGELARVAAERAPVVDGGPFEIVALEAQVARFRGAHRDESELVILPAVPETLLAAAGEREPRTALFLYTADTYRRVARAEHEDRLREIYVVNASAGVRYEARLEVLLPGGPAARWVETVDLPLFADSALGVSDLLLARSVQPRAREPAARRDFSIDPNPSLTVEPGEPFALYFEVYGLRPDADSVVAYEAALQILDAENRPLAARLLRSLGRAVGAATAAAGDLRLRWERTAPLRGDRVPEYLSIDPGELPAAHYRIRLQLRDRAGGETAVAERTFTVR